MESIRVRLRVRGRVQGVFYRASTQQRAAQLGVAGWVRNRSDGSVEIEAEGAPAAVEALVTWCRSGPSGARVDDLAQTPIAVEGASGFAIRH